MADQDTTARRLFPFLANMAPEYEEMLTRYLASRNPRDAVAGIVAQRVAQLEALGEQMLPPAVLIGQTGIVTQILQAVSTAYGLPLDELVMSTGRGSSRDPAIMYRILARRAAMKLLKVYGRLPELTIAEALGLTDHTTVRYHLDKFDELEESEVLAFSVAEETVREVYSGTATKRRVSRRSAA